MTFSEIPVPFDLSNLLCTQVGFDTLYGYKNYTAPPEFYKFTGISFNNVTKTAL